MKVWLQNTGSCEVAAFENDYEATLVVSSSDKNQFQSHIINRIVSYHLALNIIIVIMITTVDQMKRYLNLVHFLNFLED